MLSTVWLNGFAQQLSIFLDSIADCDMLIAIRNEDDYGYEFEIGL
jgi:hypothetical protein